MRLSLRVMGVEVLSIGAETYDQPVPDAGEYVHLSTHTELDDELELDIQAGYGFGSG